MERLTERTGEGQAIPRMDLKNNGHQRCMERLAEYEDLEEQGKLLKLPCEVGDTVYVKLASYCDSAVAEAEVRDFTHFISCGFYIVATSKSFNKQNIPFSEFGKTVFLTREEAEAALKGRSPRGSVD